MLKSSLEPAPPGSRGAIQHRSGKEPSKPLAELPWVSGLGARLEHSVLTTAQPTMSPAREAADAAAGTAASTEFLGLGHVREAEARSRAEGRPKAQ